MRSNEDGRRDCCWSSIRRWKTSSRMMNLKNAARKDKIDNQLLRSRCSNCANLSQSINSNSQEDTSRKGKHNGNANRDEYSNETSNSFNSVNMEGVHEFGCCLGLKWQKISTPSAICFGFGKHSKFGQIKNLIYKEKPSFLALQETKLHPVNASWIQTLWGSTECDFIQQEMVGKSGGQLLIWDSNVFDATDCIRFDRAIGVRGKWKSNGCTLNILNVYGPHDDAKKQRLWDTLTDVPLGGRMYTRVSDDGLKFSKLDRFLVSENFGSKWVNLAAVVLERNDSDHCPIRLMDDEKNFGSKPCKIFDCWLGDEEADQIVKNTWVLEAGSDTRKDRWFMNKLKKVKLELKSWSLQHFGQLDGEIDMHKNTAQALEIKAETSPLNQQELELWKTSRKSWLEKEKIKTGMLKQKARVRWILEGDENSKFFHSIIRNQYNRCNIRGVTIEGVWIDSPDAIKTETFNHFSRTFEEPDNMRPSMEDLSYPSITLEEAAELESKFLESEIFEAINDCGSTKAPGPDGCNASFVTLIPKKADPLRFGDYRPISLIGSYYKIVSKLLSNRLRKVLPSLIGIEQNAFLKGRFILDGVLIANEMVDFLKTNHKKGIISKVDFEKAFDSLNWNFLLEVMKSMGFGCKWRKWILNCLKSASISILVNGSPTREFTLGRGVRQGDPLSPFLFILAAEGLNILTKAALDKGLFKGIEVGREKVLVSHLQYANDTIFFGEWSRSNACNLMNLLKCFELTSGLKVNFQKSSIYGIGIESNELDSLAHLMGCQIGNFPFIYLGLPIGAKMKKMNDWKTVIDKFNSRLSCWKMRSMSFGGRFKTETNALWVKIIRSIYEIDGGLMLGNEASHSSSKGIWYNIVNAGKAIEDLQIQFNNSFIKVIGDGGSTSFWLDHWIGDNKLCSMFPRLFRLEQEINVSVKDRLSDGDGSRKDSWRWSLSSDGMFKVKILASEIDLKILSTNSPHQSTLRNSPVSKKVELFVWRALLRRLPVRSELDKRGIDLHSLLCPICDDVVESVDHSLIFCRQSLEIWGRVFKWWNKGNFSYFSVRELFEGNVFETIVGFWKESLASGDMDRGLSHLEES
ncbi:uncharacterized protein [Rutidosis leptorrhynchoides]|uniref:uncharacterized protein n=1 Tax=Rutidosis leptorrhynchoides TaxID=125765 RepID=UPI003A98F7BB